MPGVFWGRRYIFKAKELFRDIMGRIRPSEQDMSFMKTRAVKLEEKTDYRESEESKAAVWKHIQECKADDEISFKKNDVIRQGRMEPAAAGSGEYDEDLGMGVGRLGRQGGVKGLK